MVLVGKVLTVKAREPTFRSLEVMSKSNAVVQPCCLGGGWRQIDPRDVLANPANWNGEFQVQEDTLSQKIGQRATEEDIQQHSFTNVDTHADTVKSKLIN